MHPLRAALSVAGTALAVYFFGVNPWILVIGGFFIIREVVFDEPVEDLRVPALATPGEPKPRPSKRICVVTGASGFVGKNFVRTLLENKEYDVIRALDIITPTFDNPKVENIKGDITDLSGLKRHFEDVETVFHIASLINLRDEVHHMQRLKRVNVIGAQTVVNACIKAGVKKLVYTSSGAAVLDGRQGKVKESDFEKVLPKLTTGYGITKAEGERLILKANGVGELKTIALRPFVLFGEGDTLMVETVLTQHTIIDAENIMSTCYVGNLIEWHLLADKALDKKPEVVSGKAYFIADDNETPKTKTQLNSLIKNALKLGHLTTISSAIVYTMAYMTPPIDWITCGKIKSILMQNSPAALLYSFTNVDLDITKGMQDLGYKRKFSDQDIAKRIRAYYKLE